MFFIRPVQLGDLDQIYALSQLQTFINLPADKVVLKRKINSSIKTFLKPSKKLEDNYYVFVLVDGEANRVIGVSMIHGKHGTEKEPHFFLSVGVEEKFSKTLNTGFMHGTLKFGLETDGYTEIGGLILDPSYRGHADKLGKQLSFARFLYMGASPENFTEVIHSELYPPFDSQGKSPLWEAIGRRFLNMEYHDADMLSRENGEFILSLFPSDTIYGTLLPPEARNAIGKVGPETEPVRRMLEQIGFCYTQEVDPFDGGPHYRARLKDISLIKEMIKGPLVFDGACDFSKTDEFLVKIPITEQDFRIIRAPVIHKDNTLIIPESFAVLINDRSGKTGYAIPF
tara:strand:+ start:1415 stop:2437 length:1023 start_codon:yes stop_codon:yes gene_type:complete